MYNLDKLKMMYGDNCIVTNISDKTVLVETKKERILLGIGWEIRLASNYCISGADNGIISIAEMGVFGVKEDIIVSEKTGKMMKDVIFTKDNLIFCRESYYSCLVIYNKFGDRLQKQSVYCGEVIKKITEIKKEGIAYRIRLLAEDCNSMNRTNIEYIMIYNTSNNIIVTNRVGRIQ